MLSADTLVHLLELYGYLFLFVIAVVEGPIVTIIGAFLASLNFFNVFVVYAVAAGGDLFGDLVYYAIGRLGRTGALSGARHILGLADAELERFERYIARHGPKILIVAKYTQTGLLALPASGAARMPIGRFLFYNALATLPKTLILVVVGYFFGYAYRSIDGYFAKASVLIFAMLCIAAAYMLVHRHLRIKYDAR